MSARQTMVPFDRPSRPYARGARPSAPAGQIMSPGSVPLAPGRLWVARLVANEFRTFGLARDVLPIISRMTAVPKSAFVRPNVRQHCKSLSVGSLTPAPTRIVLLDDVVTQGHPAGCRESCRGCLPRRRGAGIRFAAHDERRGSRSHRWPAPRHAHQSVRRRHRVPGDNGRAARSR